MDQTENYTLRVDNMEKEHFQSQNADVLKVTYSIIKNTKRELPEKEGQFEDYEEVVLQNTQAFPLDMAKEELQSELQKILSTFLNDRQLAESNADRDKAQANADDLIQSFQGQKFSIELNEKVGVQAESQ